MGESVTGWRGRALRKRLMEAIRSTEPAGPPWVSAGRGLGSVDGPMLAAVGVMQVSAVWWHGWWCLVLGLTGVSASLALYGVLAVAQRAAGLSPVRIDWLYPMWLGGVAVMLLPAEVWWAVAAGVGVLTGLLAQATGRGHRSRCHPAGLAVLLVWSMSVAWPGVNPEWLRSAVQPVGGSVVDRGWAWGASGRDQVEVMPRPAAPALVLGEERLEERGNAQRLIAMGRGEVMSRPGTLSRWLQVGELPELEWVMVGRVAGPMGAGSALLMVWVALGLVYCRVHSWRVIVAGVAGATAAVWLVPGSVEGRWVWPWSEGLELLTGEGLLSIVYPLVASPMPVLLGVLACSGDPMSRPGRWVYGAIVGGVGMGCFLWLTRPEAALIGLVLGGVLSRPLDRLRRQRYGVLAEAREATDADGGDADPDDQD